MCEYFLINALDLQARFHYAPNDSSMHIAEKVMRSLNECLGDGRAIPVNYSKTVFEDVDKHCLQDLSNDKVDRIQTENEEKAAKKCAEDVKNRFHGKSCMGTSINARVPWYDINHGMFFFDEEFMQKCAHASSAVILEKCAGKKYFKFLMIFFDQHYFLYDNGFEGIRNGCTESHGKQCMFHSKVENQKLLNNGWRGVPLQRVPPPVPNYSIKDGFHYATNDQILSGELYTEVDGLKKANVMDTCLRERDDYNPRKQLDKLIDSCGTPDLKVHLEKASDVSVSAKVHDSNDTMAKAMAKVDDFVKTYTGSDLKSVVVTTIRRKIGMRIKSVVSKKAHASVKAAEKAKSFNDIDWEKHIKDNTLQKLYISQLDLYLKHAGYSQGDIGKKGFTKQKKVDVIKRHFYKNSKPSVISTLQSSTVQISLPPTEAPTQANGSICFQVPPWGGSVHFVTPIFRVSSMINTCPIDNFLVILYAFWKTNAVFNMGPTNSVESYASTLIKVFQLFEQGRYGDGKFCWLQQFTGRFDFANQDTVDVWGNEDDLFVSRVEASQHNTFQSKCSSPSCPSPVLDVHSKRVILSLNGTPPPAFIQKGLEDWMIQSRQSTICGRTILKPILFGVDVYWGLTQAQSSHTGQFVQIPQAYCNGQRHCSDRKFLNGEPPVLFLSLDYFARQGIITDFSQLPAEVFLRQRSYDLGGLTFWKPSGHYRGAVKINKDWYFYDGLWERQHVGTGLVKCTAGKPSTPSDFLLSHVVYFAKN